MEKQLEIFNDLYSMLSQEDEYNEPLQNVIIKVIHTLDEESIDKIIEENPNILDLIPEELINENRARYIIQHSIHRNVYIEKYKDNYNIAMEMFANPITLGFHFENSELRNNINFVKELASKFFLQKEYIYNHKCPMISIVLVMKQTKEFFDKILEILGNRKVKFTKGILDPTSYVYYDLNSFLKYRRELCKE